ncbi:hypothetical protein D3C83_136270 [compost metagenome]
MAGGKRGPGERVHAVLVIGAPISQRAGFGPVGFRAGWPERASTSAIEASLM